MSAEAHAYAAFVRRRCFGDVRHLKLCRNAGKKVAHLVNKRTLGKVLVATARRRQQFFWGGYGIMRTPLWVQIGGNINAPGG